MASRSWSQSGRPKSAAPRSARPEGSFSASVARAREWWDDLTGGPGPEVVDCDRCSCGAGSALTAAHARGCAGVISTGRYSDAAAAAILSLAVALWADTAAGMAPGRDGE